MKSVFNLFLTIILVVFCMGLSSAQDNPFMQIAGMKYADSLELHDVYLKFTKLDTIGIRKIINQIKETAKKTGSKEWILEVEYSELALFDIKRKLEGDEKYPAKKLLMNEFALLEKAKRANLPQLELKVRHAIILNYWQYIKNYELAFEQCAIQEEQLQKISSEDIPEKAIYYVPIANAHFFFKDYPKAISYFEKILNEPESVHNYVSKQHARNGMGLCYRAYNDFDRSDSYFRTIMETVCLRSEDEYLRDNWNGIAEGNIGRNMLFRGEYDKAIPLLKSSIEKMLKYNDFAYASGPAINLADIYLKKGDIVTAKRYINLSIDYYAKMQRDDRLARIYKTMSKYYAAIGNIKLSMAYMDSTLAEHKKFEEQFNALQLIRVEQRNHLLIQKLKDEQLNIEKIRSAGYRRGLIIAITGLFLIGGVLVLYLILYRKKQAAYRELVRKSQEWAQVKTETIEPEQINMAEQTEQEKQNDIPDEVDVLIIKTIEQLMRVEKIFKDKSLSVDSLSQKIDMKSHYVSRAINHCTHKNFNAFVNEYRIKEAVRRISDSSEKLSFEGIALEIGFNDRRNFYRVFKKMTGLSPAEFKDSLSHS